VEERLEVATANNARMLLAWDLAANFDHLAITCHGATFEPSVIEHLATSLTRMLGVGKRMGIVDKGLLQLTIVCTGHAGATEPLTLRYDIT
jgi:hypothetical protein